MRTWTSLGGWGITFPTRERNYKNEFLENRDHTFLLSASLEPSTVIAWHLEGTQQTFNNCFDQEKNVLGICNVTDTLLGAGRNGREQNAVLVFTDLTFQCGEAESTHQKYVLGDAMKKNNPGQRENVLGVLCKKSTQTRCHLTKE